MVRTNIAWLVILSSVLFFSCSDLYETGPVSPEEAVLVVSDPVEPTDTWAPSVYYCAKIYGNQLDQEAADWIMQHCEAMHCDAFANSVVNYMKATKPEMLLLRYIQASAVSELSDPVNAVPGYRWIDRNNPDWFLVDSDSSRWRTHFDPAMWWMDPGKTGWRDFWLYKVQAMLEGYDYDGVYGDYATIDIREHWAPNGLYFYDSDEEWNIANEAYLDTIQQYLNSWGRIWILNNSDGASSTDSLYLINTRLNSCDGSDYQAFAMRASFDPERVYKEEEDVLFSIRTAYYHGEVGKIAILSAQPNPDTTQVAYGVGCYLLAKNSQQTYFTIDWLAEYSILRSIFYLYGHILQKNYGQPVGEMWNDSPAVWKREYTRGIVEVNFDTHVFTFHPNGTYEPPEPEEVYY